MIELVVSAVNAIAADEQFLQRRGLTSQDFELALPAAIQRIRGSAAASTADRRFFLTSLFEQMVSDNLISSFEKPDYGDDTVYRLQVAGLGRVAIIQKGCPDGEHSSVNWTKPEWATETYLWWLCDSLQYEPGEHVAKGMNRVRNRFFSAEFVDAVDGVVFNNRTCGTSARPCPKIDRAIEVGGVKVPPPCIWTMPVRENLKADPGEWNWNGDRTVRFPSILLAAFGVSPQEAALYTGHVGFSKGPRGIRTTIASRFGPGRSTVFRSTPR